MKKKFLYIFVLAFVIVLVSLLFKTHRTWIGDPYRGHYSDTFGFPLPMEPAIFLYGYGFNSAVLGQLILFFVNLFFYFVIFSAIYYSYSKLANKVKKK